MGGRHGCRHRLKLIRPTLAVRYEAGMSLRIVSAKHQAFLTILTLYHAPLLHGLLSAKTTILGREILCGLCGCSLTKKCAGHTPNFY